ncbi:hypothetical protein [Streptomyces sp. NPDC047108]|uniref:hypothetical protein n=1 Tax=Streptomyces sp. NPDC047108 TaxID=3155025 RepID=UPI003410EFFA
MYYWERPTHEPSCEATEAPGRTEPAAPTAPGGPGRGSEVRTDVYAPGYEPAAWIRASGKWRFGVIRARHSYADGVTELHVDLAIGMDRFRRVYRWPQPGILPAHPGRRLTRGRGAATGAVRHG